ncbi:MAG: phosphotransferase family protein [Woeseiaceae bacterium]|nr:phosphotransferase family protein [Woeseiaceae bacterium]
MSGQLTVREAIDRIPGWDRHDVLVEELHGGLTNRTFRATRQGTAFVLRLDAAHTGTFLLDRRLEALINSNAADAGLAPRVIFADPAAGILVSEYLHGTLWSRQSLDDHGNLVALGELLRRVHDLPLSGTRLDRHAVARHYARKLGSSAGPYAFARRCEEIIAGVPPSGDVCCCHNDVIAQNIIAVPQLRLLDWEYACDNDPLFDLASLIGFHDLGKAPAGVLLDAYSGGADGELREYLEMQLRIYDAIHWLWLANRQLLSHDRGLSTRLEELQRRIA